MSKLSGMPLNALRRVFERGIGAAKTNPVSVRMKGTFKKGVIAPPSQKLSPEQWAYGRVYAFLMKTPTVFYGADKDVAVMYNLI